MFNLIVKERSKILKQAKGKRFRKSEAGQKYEEKPSRKKYRKVYRKALEHKEYLKVYRKTQTFKKSQKTWAQSAKGRKSKQRRDARYFTNHPWKLEALKEVWKQFSKLGHRISKPKRLNQEFLSNFEKQARKYKKQGGVFAGLRVEHLSEYENQIEFTNLSAFNTFLHHLNDYFTEKDSRVSNYVYILCDSLVWHDKMTFGEFLASIFYVGRGVGGHFMDHLREVQIIINNDHEIDEEKVNFYFLASFILYF